MAEHAQAVMDQTLIDKVRGLISNTKTELNILVVGRVGVGKSTLINSAHMAVAGTWNEFAMSGGGGATNNTKYLMPYTMFKPEHMASSIEGYDQTIKMWDFAGMENLSEDSYFALIGLTLEGRVPAQTCVLPLLNDSSDSSITPQKLSRKFPKIVEEHRFHRVVMVCEADKDVPENLVSTVMRAAQTQEGRSIPIVVVMSKTDKATDEYRQRREEALKCFQLVGNEERFFETGLYSDLNPNCSRTQDKAFNREEEIDRTLLAMWRVLLNPVYDESLLWEKKEDTGSKSKCPVS